MYSTKKNYSGCKSSVGYELWFIFLRIALICNQFPKEVKVGLTLNRKF